MKAAFYTLGCKVNSYDTQMMIEDFKRAGYEIVDFNQFADVYVISTCTVTHLGDKKSRQVSRRARRINPDAIVVATGCYAQVDPEALNEIPEIDLVVGTKDKADLVEILREHKKGIVRSDFERKEPYSSGIITETPDHTRAFIKIQDGCNQFCSYCIVPYARGPIRSRDEEEVLREISELVKAGYREVVLSGIHLASYGLEKGDPQALIRLIRKLPETGIERFRLSSLEPGLISSEFLKTLKETDIFMESFHLSLQSGSETVLKRMRRRYTPEEYLKKLELIRSFFPNAGVTTDIIVGFPGETEEEFEETLDFVRVCQFSNIHIFPYSPRKGTAAAGYPDQVAAETKKRRVRRLENLKSLLVRRFQEKNTGRTAEVLVERKLANGFYSGYTENYIPVLIDSDEDLRNRIISIRLDRKNMK